MYELHNLLRPILFAMYSFWIPQIITNVIRDTRKPLHPHYIIGMTLTRAAIPLYVFGCPSNFLRIQVDRSWCIFLGLFMGLQALILLLQYFLGSRWFIPRQVGLYLKPPLLKRKDVELCCSSIWMTANSCPQSPLHISHEVNVLSLIPILSCNSSLAPLDS